MAQPKPIRAVVLDVFGTLVKAPPMRSAAYARLAEASGLERFRSEVMRRSISLEALADELGLTYLLPILNWELNEEVAQMRFCEGVEGLIPHIKLNGFKVALCSNLAHAYGEPVRRLLPNADAYVYSYEVGHAKPEPEIYQAVCDALSCDPKECLLVGDSLRNDVEGPLKFGMSAILGGWPNPSLLRTLAKLGVLTASFATKSRAPPIFARPS
jgi:HAD superfamily hydrolase (TIGR01549 family)